MEISVNGIVAQRDTKPYVQVMRDRQVIAQSSIAEARLIAQDILVAASYAEADAMIGYFFGKMDFPTEAYNALLVEFRDFRHKLASAGVVTTVSSPDGQKGPSKA